MKAIERLYKYLEYKGVKPGTFEKEIQLSNGYLSKMFNRKADIGEGIIVQITENCPELNVEWLVTGRGEMLKTEAKVLPASKEAEAIYKELLADRDTTISSLNQEIGRLKERVAGFQRDGRERKGSVGLSGGGDPVFIPDNDNTSLPELPPQAQTPAEELKKQSPAKR